MTLHFVDKLSAPLFEIPYTRDLIQHLSCSTWLASFSMTISRPIPVAASGMISLSLWLSNSVMSCWAQSETSTVMERAKIDERPVFTLRIEVTKGGTVICLHKSVHQVLKSPARNAIFGGGLRFSFSFFVWKMKDKETAVESALPSTTGRKEE